MTSVFEIGHQRLFIPVDERIVWIGIDVVLRLSNLRKPFLSTILDKSRKALRMAGDGDIIVLAGKGHETYQEIMGIKRPFDEKVIVSELLTEIREEEEKTPPTEN